MITVYWEPVQSFDYNDEDDRFELSVFKSTTNHIYDHQLGRFVIHVHSPINGMAPIGTYMFAGFFEPDGDKELIKIEDHNIMTFFGRSVIEQHHQSLCECKKCDKRRGENPN